MAKEKEQQEEESGESAPLWIISFADMISLLMAFFVMLSTFSSFGGLDQLKLKAVSKSALAPYGGLCSPPKNDMSPGLNPMASTSSGSEKPTEYDKSEGSMTPAEDTPNRTNKVFTLNSIEMFYGSSVSLSTKGKAFLDTMAEYIIKTNARITIGEASDKISPLGLNRAIVTARYMIDQGVSEDSINITPQVQWPAGDNQTRKFQIMILEKEIYE